MAVAYLEIDLRLTPKDPWRDVMIAQMGLLGFESFVYSPDGFKAYIPKNDFREKDFLKIDVFDIQRLNFKWETKVIPPQNWNRQWEENFSPIRVGERCIVRTDFHPHEKVEYELVITPKMSFGTGHHETTQMMISLLLDLNCNNKSVLDMGSGTGVLGILAEKKGAKAVLAVDNDPWCIENTQENLELNKCINSKTELNNTVPLKNTFEMVLANINRNVLLEQISYYGHILVPEGDLLLSGFYFEDLGMIQNACQIEGFRFIRNLEKKNWVAAYFTKYE
ncbi:MAG: 50S ribosomal protein L11 methyltransferase [Bacteroidota bacterium]|nr:50S ribosomal protein L11 methyltransferase [Bacteroidota bacterium]